MSQNIEQLANKIIQAEKISKPPINAERIAEFHFGLDIEWTNFENNDAAAQLSVSDKKIYMNESRADKFRANCGLKNFTIAHEIGHWVLHRNLVGQHSPKIEREAEKFATYLLMPEQFVRDEFAKFNSDALSDYLSADRKVSLLAETFCVSYTAMRIRLSHWELKLIYVDKDGKIYRSKEEFLEQLTRQIRLF